MNKQVILETIKTRLQKVYRERLVGVVLYGSVARGDITDESDIDILVLLNGPVEYGNDLETNINALYPLSLELGRRISAKPVDANEYETVMCPLYEASRKEGISA